MISVNGLHKSYKEKVVVDDVSFTVEPGKITSLIGPNGAGKSTVLSMMSRLLDPDKGSILIEGKEITQWDNNELAKKMSILKQTNHMNLRLSVRDFVGFGRFPHSQGRKTAEDEYFIQDALDKLKLGDLENQYIDQLSGGQRQRAYIAMCLAQNPRYLFLDEPLNNLDMKHSVRLMKVLQDLSAKDNVTIVTVIHDINFASCYSDYMIAMKDGKVACAGKKDDIVNKSVLEELYDMQFHLQHYENRRICIYY
ncbi:MAG: ABC transporter ATP-binding protein [Bacilli bacterium]